MPWEKDFDEAEVLDAAMLMFWEHGYQGVSMADLVDGLGVNRSSLYATYGNKEELFCQALRRYDQVHRQDWFSELADTFEPLDSIRQSFIQVAAAPDPTRRLGCLLVNTTLDVPLGLSGCAEVVRAAFDSTQRFFAHQLELAKARSEVGPDCDTEDLATTLMATLLGTRVLTRAQTPHEALERILRQVDEMLVREGADLSPT